MSISHHLFDRGYRSFSAANDISKGSYAIQKVRTTFAGAHGILTAAAFHRAELMKSRRNGRNFSFGGVHNSESSSILASIVGVTHEVCKRECFMGNGFGVDWLIQTSHRRRLIQTVYNDRTLHRMLGVEPRQAAVPAPAPEPRRTISFQSESSRHQSKTSVQVVEEIYKEADMEMESEMEKPERHRHHRDRSPEGRYDIGRREQPPTKRRKMGTVRDTHTVFTTDDDEEEDSLVVTAITDEGESLEEYESDGDAEKVALESRAARRSYWLSKGVGPGAIDGDSS